MLLVDRPVHVAVELVLAERRDARLRREPRRGRRRRNREPAPGELRVENRDRDGADVGRRQTERRREPRGGAVAVRQLDGDDRERQAVVERRAVALARALVRREEEELVLHDGAAERAAELFTFEDGARTPGRVEEEIVGVQRVVADEGVDVAVELAPARLRDGLDVAARVAALRRVVERSEERRV